MTDSNPEDEDAIVQSSPSLDTSSTESNNEEDLGDPISPLESTTQEDLEEDDIFKEPSEEESEDLNSANLSNEITYAEEKIDFRGESTEALIELIRAAESEMGPSALDIQTRTVGSWANTVFRAILEPNYEESRLQEALASLSKEDKDSLSSRLRNDEGKTLLRTTSLREKLAPGETKSFTGDAALMAFEFQESGGGYRVPLYNSGITLDLIVPTGKDIQTLLTNCLIVDRDLGTSSGAHYFTYSDLMYKTQILNFIQPLIVNSSYTDWRKKNKLWSIIKLNDLAPLVATIAALCYRDGYEGFVTKCTRPTSETHPTLCRHTETINANIFDLIITRFATMHKEAIDFMVAARMGTVKHTVGQIAKYQSELAFEGERLTFGNITFVMRIPTLAEHAEAGQKFIADIVNEIEGDNNEGRLEQFGLRYIRTFLPWIASVEKKDKQDAVVRTNDARVIVRMLEHLDDKDAEGKFRDSLRAYINKTQLTYVGYPVTECPECHYVADTPSGMWTFDPFSAFFTLALQYLTPASSTASKV